MPRQPTPSSRRTTGRARAAAIAVAMGLSLAAVSPASAQATTGRQLLDWCQGGLGSSVTATFDAFQCEAYLQAYLDQQQETGADFTRCLGRRSPDAAHLLARILPELERRAQEDGAALRQPASVIVGDWIRGNCQPETSAETPPEEDAGDDPADDQAAADRAVEAAAAEAAIEMAIWRATQQIADRQSRISAIEHYLELYPEGRFATVAALQMEDLRNAEAPDDAGEETAGAPEDGTGDATEEVDVAANDPPPIDPETTDPDMIFWLLIKDSQDPEDYDEYLRRFPDGQFAGLAENRRNRLLAEAEAAADEPADGPPVVIEETEASERDRLAALEAGLDRDERRAIQNSLGQLGLYTMAIDGIFGPGTRRAIRGFQQRLGTEQTGYLTAQERAALFAQASPTPVSPARANTSVAPSFTVRNRGQNPLMAIHASPVWSQTWDFNRLNNSVVLPQTQYLVRLPDYASDCLFDVLLVDTGNLRRTVWSIDLCRTDFVDFP